MTVAKLKTVAATVVLLGTVSAAQAGFTLSDNWVPGQKTITIVDSNNFKGILGTQEGVFDYTLGATLGVDVVGTVTYYYYGKEAGYKNVFTAGALSQNSGYTPTLQNYFYDPIKIGSLEVGAGALSFQFCAFSAGNVGQGCLTNAVNDKRDLGSTQSIAYSVSGNTAWIFWDDSGAGPDDNHDDMIIKAVFTPKSVPEPATLGLLGLGLLGTWVGSKRRRKIA